MKALCHLLSTGTVLLASVLSASGVPEPLVHRALLLAIVFALWSLSFAEKDGPR